MLDLNLKHTLAIVIVAAGVLASAGSASAGTQPSSLVLPNGHAGLGTSVYQHNQTDLEFLAFSSHPARVTDGTSNTITFGARAPHPGTGTAVIESIGTKYTMSLPLQVQASKNELAIETIEAPAVSTGDVYDYEMGLRAARFRPEIDDEVL